MGVDENGKPKIYGIVSSNELHRRQRGPYNPDLARQIAASGPTMVGLALILQGEDRFNIPGFTDVRHIMPGYVWGILFLTCGLLMMANAFNLLKWVFWPAFFAATIAAFWSILLTVSAIRFHSAWTGPAVYTYVTLCMAGVAVGDSYSVVNWFKERFRSKT